MQHCKFASSMGWLEWKCYKMRFQHVNPQNLYVYYEKIITLSKTVKFLYIHFIFGSVGFVFVYICVCDFISFFATGFSRNEGIMGVPGSGNILSH